MKVLKIGKWNNPWSGTFVCKICDAQLLVEEADLQPQGNDTNSNFYQCPECGKVNYIPSDQLPQRVLEELNKKRKYWSSGDW